MKKICQVLIIICLIAFQSACSTEETRLSSNGRQIYEPWTEISYSEDGKEEISYNKYGDLEKYEIILDEDGEEAGWTEYKNEYDGEGRLIRQEKWGFNSADDGGLVSYDVYEYDGNTRNGKTYDSDGDLFQTSKAILNEKGLVIQLEVDYVDGEYISKSTFLYDEHGHYLKIVHNYNPQKNIWGVEQKSVDWEYTYKQGHPVTAEWTAKEVGEEDKVYSGTTEYVY